MPIARRLFQLSRRYPDWVVAGVLFLALTCLSWRRTASFIGDLNREWTTPMRVAAGERLYSEVGFYYGPLGPYVGGAAMRLLGSRTGTMLALGILAAAGTLAAILAASRSFLPVPGRVAVAAVATGVLAFAPRNGAFVTSYSLSALLAVGLSWIGFGLAGLGRPLGAGLAGALAVLSKVEAAPAVVVSALRLKPRHGAALLFMAGFLALAGYFLACRGIPLDQLVSYGPLRHFRMPPEFRELYIRAAGLHPGLRPRSVPLALGGAGLVCCWVLAIRGALARRLFEAGAAGALLLGGLAAQARWAGETLLTTAVRGLPLLVAAATLVAARTAMRSLPGSEERTRALGAASAGLLGLSFIWRTVLWTVPLHAYPPLAAVSSLPAVAWLISVPPTRGRDPSRRSREQTLLLLPALAAPLFALPGLVEAYRGPRTAVEGPRGTWLPPDPEGPVYQKVVSYLEKAGVKDRSLVVIPEASAIGFLLGVRSPLRFEQFLPGHVDAAMDRELAEEIDRTRPRWIVWTARVTPEFGSARLGVDYAREVVGRIRRDYVQEVRFSVPGAPEGWGWAEIYRRKEP